MVDLCKCKGERCNKKESCYRYTAPADELWQAYFAGTPNVDGCSHYIPVGHYGNDGSDGANAE